jgi:hypothetical protein
MNENIEDEYTSKGKTMAEMDAGLDEAAKSCPSPKKKTPEEMLQNPADCFDPEDQNVPKGKNDGAWDAAEGKGPHDASINDNDSKNGPAR